MLIKRPEFTDNDTVAHMVGYFSMTFTSSVLISTNWLLTASTIIVSGLLTLFYYSYVVGFNILAIVYSIVFLIVLTIYVCFFCEKKFKREFL